MFSELKEIEQADNNSFKYRLKTALREKLALVQTVFALKTVIQQLHINIINLDEVSTDMETMQTVFNKFYSSYLKKA